MQITKKQSFFIAGGAIALFFLVGIIFLKADSKTVKIAVQNSMVTAEPTLSAPPALPTAVGQTAAPSGTPGSEGSLVSGIFTMNEFHRSEVQDGRKLWEVHGHQAQLFPERNAVKVSDAELSVFQKNGKETQLNTKQATLYMNGPSLAKAHLENGVQVVYNHEYTLTADEAFCDRVANTITIPTPLKIAGEAMEISGQKLEGTIDSQVFTISGDVVTLIKPGAKKPSEIK